MLRRVAEQPCSVKLCDTTQVYGRSANTAKTVQENQSRCLLYHSRDVLCCNSKQLPVSNIAKDQIPRRRPSHLRRNLWQPIGNGLDGGGCANRMIYFTALTRHLRRSQTRDIPGLALACQKSSVNNGPRVALFGNTLLCYRMGRGSGLMPSTGDRLNGLKCGGTVSA